MAAANGNKVDLDSRGPVSRRRQAASWRVIDLLAVVGDVVQPSGDLLLPKLIAGEIRLTDAEAIAEAPE